VAVAAFLLFILTGAIIPLLTFRPATPNDSGTKSLDTVGPGKKLVGEGGPPVSVAAWLPKGYEASDPSQTVPERSYLPMELRRQEDGTIFKHLRDEIYLPAGYRPENEDNASGAEKWPQVIVRERDNVRFIRIPGGTFERGDPREVAKALDFDNQPM